ncbi:hypothetical protein ACFQRD_07925 [Brachybacterium sp. GCM10030268]|uniref:hypothetical protein n=1 Tax=Brachybacterium sp. GCM10030268 TaxID=3273382 RepID=UPI00360902D4
MSPFDLILVIYGAILSLTALSVVYRMIVGPTILDRAVSTDSLVVLVVIGMAVYTAHVRAAWAGPAMLALTGLALIGTVTFARFVAREEPMQGTRRRHQEEPHTDTGPLDAIHVDHRDGASGRPVGSQGAADGPQGVGATDSAGSLGADAEGSVSSLSTIPEVASPANTFDLEDGQDAALEVGEAERGFEAEDGFGLEDGPGPQRGAGTEDGALADDEDWVFGADRSQGEGR